MSLSKRIAVAGLLLASLGLQGCAGLVVGGAATGAVVAHDRRSTGTIVDDQIIELKALDSVLSDTQLFEQTNIRVIAYNRNVLVAGQSPSEELARRAYTLVKDISGVRRVHEELEILAPSSLLTRSSDSWISTKTKTGLFKIDGLPDFDPTRVKVVTENGTVFLMGIVTREEGDAATEIARHIRGVQRVVKLFEYQG